MPRSVVSMSVYQVLTISLTTAPVLESLMSAGTLRGGAAETTDDTGPGASLTGLTMILAGILSPASISRTHVFQATIILFPVQ